MPPSDKHIAGYLLLLILGIILFYHFELGDDFDSKDLIVFVVAGLVASVFPDLDIGNSKIRKFTNRILSISLVILIALYWQMRQDVYLIGAVLIALAFLLLSFSKHRQIFHSWVFWLLVSIGVGYFNAFVGAGILFGSWSHLGLDRVF